VPHWDAHRGAQTVEDVEALGLDDAPQVHAAKKKARARDGEAVEHALP
jgi:hypothetical protein